MASTITALVRLALVRSALEKLVLIAVARVRLDPFIEADEKLDFAKLALLKLAEESLADCNEDPTRSAP